MAPDGYNWKEITAYVMKRHNLEISGGLGPSAGMVVCNTPLSSELECYRPILLERWLTGSLMSCLTTKSAPHLSIYLVSK